MRKKTLRQAVNRYLKIDNRGDYKAKKHRAFVLHKLIDDLFILRDVPAFWSGFKKTHLENLIKHWQQQKLKPATLMRYMTVIRRFLHAINCEIPVIDNQSLNLIRLQKTVKKSKPIKYLEPHIFSPLVQLIFNLQRHFGLTFSEAIAFIPAIHLKPQYLWITREIAFNSADRMIPIRTDVQYTLLQQLNEYTESFKNLKQAIGYEALCAQWRGELLRHYLRPNKTYRYLYAQWLYKELTPAYGSYHVQWLIFEEMGIKSRNTLWKYLHE